MHVLLERSHQTFAVQGRAHFHENRSPHDLAQGGFYWTIQDQNLIAARGTACNTPLYYRGDDQSCVLSPSLKELLQHSPEAPRFDWPSILVFLCLGYFIGDRTAFEGVLELPPGSRLTWDVQTGLQRRDPPVVAPEARQFPNADAPLRVFDRLVREAIAPHDTQHAAQGLSGGYDSRHILFACQHEGTGVPQSLITAAHYINPMSAQDTYGARLVADTIGAPLQTVQPWPDRVAAEIEKNRMTGLTVRDHSWTVPLTLALSTQPLLLDGLNGGILFGRGGPVILAREIFGVNRPPLADLSQMILDHLLTPRLEALRPWLPPHILSQDTLDQARQLFLDTLSHFEEFPNPLQAFLHANHVVRDTARMTYGMTRNPTVLCPMDSPDMRSFAFSLPWELSTDATFQLRALHVCYPQYKNLPFGQTLSEPDVTVPNPIDPISEAASVQQLRDRASDAVVDLFGDTFLSFFEKPLSLPHIQRLVFLSQLALRDL